MSKGTEFDSSRVAIGKIVKAQGLAGELKAVSFSDDPADLVPYKKFYLVRDLVQQEYVVDSCRVHGKFAIVKLREIVDRDGAEAHIGCDVLVARSQMPRLNSDEFYWHDMVGMQVMTDQGLELGKVTSLIATGANDVMVVTGRDQEYLIPVLQEIIVRQDTEAGILVIAPMAGLLEMNSPDAL